jgi:hypothetical protein
MTQGPMMRTNEDEQMEETTRQILDTIGQCVDGKNLLPFPRNWLMRLPEGELVQAIEYMEEANWSQAQIDALEFLINVRRFHNAYLRNNELWGFLEQHLGENFEEVDRESRFFGLVVDIAGGRTGAGFTLIPITNAEREDTSYKAAEMFRNIPLKEGRQVMHVLYLDMDMTKQHHVAFSMMLELPWLAHNELEQIEETFELIEFFVKLPQNLDEMAAEVNAFRSELTNRLLGKGHDLLQIAIVHSSDLFEGDFHRDLLVFLMDICMVVDGIKLKQEVIENGFEEVDKHRAMLIDYTPTLEGNPPMMNHLSERVALKVLETIDEPGLLRQQWEANLKILRKIPEGEIGLMHTNDAMSAKHNFPFDMTTLFDPRETK